MITSGMTYEQFAGDYPLLHAALIEVEKALAASGFDAGLVELVKLRASQMNGCGFCLRYHLAIAREVGVPQRKLDLLPVWKETACFDDRERAALIWTEALTDLAHTGDLQSKQKVVREQFSSAELVHLTAMISAINSWNRLAISLGFPAG